MALVRKYKEAGPIDNSKKVLTYENVGTYDAESLAAALTADLEGYANSLKLTGQNRQDFLKYGAMMIQAIKDGNVTKNADGTFTIKGDYGLNNTYSDLDVAKKRSEGEVGWGAKPYQGSFQESHGVFTTQGTEDFRNRNHTLGLVGQWLNHTLRSSEPTAPISPTFSITQYLSDKLYRGNDKLRQEWEALYPKQQDRFNQIATHLKDLTDEDYDTWAKTDTAIGDQTKIRDLVTKLSTSLQNNDITGARDAAFRLGFTLKSIVNYDTNTDADDFNRLAIDKLGVGASEQEIKDYEETLRTRDEATRRNARAKALQDQIEDLWETFKESERFNIHKFVNDNVINKPAFFGIEGATLYNGFVEEQHKVRNSLIDNLPKEDSEAGRDLGEILDRIIDAYDYAQLELSKNPDSELKNFYNYVLRDLFDKVTYSENGKSAEEWLLLRHLSTLKYSIIYNPKNHRLLRISNSLLGESSPYYNRLKDEFMINHKALFKQEGGPINSIYVTSQGDTLDFSVFDRKPAPADSTTKAADNNTPGNTPDNTPEEESTPISEIDEYRLYAALADIASFGFSFTALGSVGSAAAGLGATSLNLAADRMDPNVSNLQTAINAGVGYFGDIVSILPYIGAIRKAKTLNNSLNIVATVGTSLLAAYGVTNIKEHLHNITNLLSNPTDKKAWADGLSSLTFFLNAFTTIKNLRRAKRDSEHFVLSDYKIKSQEGKEYEVPADVYERIKNAHTYEQANAEFQNYIQNEHYNLPYTKTTQDEKQLTVNGIQNEVLPAYYTIERRGTEYVFTPKALDRGFASLRIGDALAEYGGMLGRGAVRTYDWLSGYRNTGVPKGSTVYSDDRFQLGNRTYTRGEDGRYHVDSEEVSKENIKNYKAKQKAAADRAARARQKAWDARKKKVTDTAKRTSKGVSDWFAEKVKKYTSAYEAEPKATEAATTGTITPIGEAYQRIIPNSPVRYMPNSYVLGRYVLDEIKKFNATNHTNISLDDYLDYNQLKYIFDANDGKPVAGLHKQGGILALTDNLEELLKEGGILIPKDAKGKKITSQKDRSKVLYGDDKFANWWNGIDPSDMEDAEWDENDFDWEAVIEDMDEILGINTPNESDDITHGNTQGPYRSEYNSRAGKEEAARREKDPIYAKMTKAVAAALRTGQITNPGMLKFLLHLQEHYKKRHGDQNFPNYINEDGSVIGDKEQAAKRFESLRTDSASSHANYSMGPHHSMAKYREERPFYYKGKTQITDPAEQQRLFANIKDPTYQSWDDRYHNLYYVIDDDDQNPATPGDDTPAGGTTAGGTTGGNAAGGTEQLTPAADNIYGDLDIGWRINWGNINEIARTLMLTRQNRKAFEQITDWDPALLGYIHRMGLQRGNKPVLDQAWENDASLGWMAGQTHSNDAALQLAGLTEATDRGGLGKLQAAGSDAQEYWSSIQRIQDIHNQDLEYNLGKTDINRQSIAAKDKETAEARAGLTLANATSLNNLMQGFSKQMFDRYANITEMLKQRQLLKEYNRRAAAARIFQAKIDNLSATDQKTYEAQLKRIQQEYLQDIGAYDDEDIRTMRKIIGRRIMITPDLKISARRGRKLSAGDHYILQDSKDFNRRKLAEVKEFYKNMRENNKKRKS